MSEKKNSYIPIQNEVWDALVRTRIPGEARQVLDFIIRKTIGWGKTWDAISYSQMSKATGIPYMHVASAITKLQEMNLISLSEKGYSRTKRWRFNEVFSTWKPLPKKGKVYPKKGKVLPENGYKTLPENGIHNIQCTDNSTKDSTSLSKNGKVPYEDFVNLFNNICGNIFNKQPIKLTPGRKKNIASRWHEEPSLEYWETVFRRMSTAPHCLGKNDRGWKASFNFIIQNGEKHVMLMEGAYDRGIGSIPTIQRSPELITPACHQLHPALSGSDLEDE